MVKDVLGYDDNPHNSGTGQRKTFEFVVSVSDLGSIREAFEPYTAGPINVDIIDGNPTLRVLTVTTDVPEKLQDIATKHGLSAREVPNT
mgnify:CR=1 FL=1